MIHSSSVIDKNAKVSKSVKVGPFCFIGPDVELSDGVELISNVHIEGNTKIGKNTKIFPFASIGTQPQDLKFKNEKNSLSINSIGSLWGKRASIVFLSISFSLIMIYFFLKILLMVKLDNPLLLHYH